MLKQNYYIVNIMEGKIKEKIRGKGEKKLLLISRKAVHMKE